MGDVQTGKEYIAEVLPQELESRDPGGLALGGGATGASGFESQQGLVTEKAMQPTPVLLPGESHGQRSWWAAVHGVAQSRTRLSNFTFHFHALEREMATHSSVLAWRIPGTAEPGGLPSQGSHRVGQD